MIDKVILNPDEELSPCVVKWDDKKEDYVVDVPKNITRADLVDLVDEIKRITLWDE